MKELKHLMYFERLLDDAHNELVRQAEAEGDLAIGYTCFHAPEVLLNLGSCFSVRLRAPHTTSMELATYYMANNSCEFSRAILERALEGNYSCLHAMAGVDVCEANNRAIENMEIMHAQGADKDKFFYCNLDIPYSDDEDCVEHICEQVSRKILKPMRENYGVDTSDAAIRAAVSEHNEVCRILTEIGQLRKEENPRITGYEYHILNLVSYCCPKYLIVDKLRETLEELRHREPDARPNFRVKIAVVGSEIDDPGFTKLVEEAGALVVVDRFCFGSTPGREEIRLDPDLPVLESIARHYLTTSQCPTCARSTTRRACCTNSSSSASTGAMSARWRATSSRTTTASRPSRSTGRTPPAATASCARACRHSSRVWRSSSSRRREEASDHG